MKYILLAYLNEQEWDALPEARRAEIEASCHAAGVELAAAGKVLGGEPLQPVATATTVRSVDGKHVITDGPFAETHEQLGGYCLLEAADLDEAIAIARRVQGDAPGAIEVRPIKTTN